MLKEPSPKPTPALRVANFFGVFGYMSVLLEWLWICGLLVYPLVNDGKLNWFLPPAQPVSEPASVMAMPSGPALVIGIFVTAICVALAVYAMYTMPRQLSKAGSKAAKVAAKAIVPTITHHRKISRKRKLKLTYEIITMIKFSVAVIPIFVCFFIPNTFDLDYSVVVVTTIFLASWAIFDFGIQQAISKLAKLDPANVW